MVSQNLPGHGRNLPRYLYLWKREVSLQERMSHRPTRVSVTGQIRSHVELERFARDILERQTQIQRDAWQIRVYQSPQSQKEWSERWPEVSSNETLSVVDQVQVGSLPLATIATICPPQTLPPANAQQSGFWIWSEESSTNEPKICTQPLGKNSKKSAFLVLLNDPESVSPLKHYLETPWVARWLTHHAEQKFNRWVLTEQLLKFLPVSKALVSEIQMTQDQRKDVEAEWPKAILETLKTWTNDPNVAREELIAHISEFPKLAPRLGASLFVRTSKMLDQRLSGQEPFNALFCSKGEVLWSEILKLLSDKECTTISTHPMIKLVGTLPPHLPIGRIDRIKSPCPAVMFATENGFQLRAECADSKLIDMILSQLTGVDHPTWSELLNHLKLPRSLEIADSMANELLHAHGDNANQIDRLRQLLSTCPLF